MRTETAPSDNSKGIPGTHLDDVLDNPAFAALCREARRKRRERLIMVLIYPIPWLIGGYYVAMMRGMPGWLCALAGIHFTLTMLMLLACLFFFGGIEGYEASIALKPYSLDLWMAGVKPKQLGSAIVAHGSGRYHLPQLRFAALLVAGVMLVGVTSFLPRVETTTIWLAAQCFLPTTIFIVCIGRQDVFLIANALMWIGLVRRRYENEFPELTIVGESRGIRIRRSLRNIVLACLMIVGTAWLSMKAYQLVERTTLSNIRPIPYENLLAFGASAVLIHASAGLICGYMLLRRARGRAEARFKQLSEEMFTLTRYRAELKRDR